MSASDTTPSDITDALNRIHDLSNYTAITKNKTLLTRWVFTWHNYTDSDLNKLKIFGQKYCKYLIFGMEISPTTKTKHLQGYIHLLKRMSYFQLRNFLGDQPFLYMAKKNDLANYRYCSKSNDFYFYECTLGGTQTEASRNQEKPKKLSTKERMEIAYDLAKQERFGEIDKDLLIKHGKVLKSLKIEDLQIENNLFYDQGEDNYFHCHNLWIWGETGSGKSFFITYFIKGINYWWKLYCDDHNIEYFELRAFNHQKTKWWCGYMGEEIVIINEVNPTFCSWYANEIKEWVDQYPFNAEVKGSNIGKIRPLFFIFTSNYNLDECFCEMRGRDVVKDEITGKPKLLTEDIKAMHRRMKVIKRTKEDRNKLVRWPCIKMLNKYHDTINKVKEEMEKIQSNFNSIIKNSYDEYMNLLNNNKSITFVDETNKTIEKATTSNKKDKGKQPYESPQKRKSNSQSSSSTSTPKNKKPKTKSPKKPLKPEVGICEKCQKAKIKNSVTEGWWCELCEKDPLSCTCSPISELKIKNPLFNNLNNDSIIEINNSFISNINNDKVITSTQKNSNSIPKDKIEEIPSSPLKQKFLERHNAILYDENIKQFIGDPPSENPFCSTPDYHDSIIDSDDDFMPKKTKKEKNKEPIEEESIEYGNINLNISDLNKIEDDIKKLQEESNKNINDLADDQETYSNIPQVDGCDDSLMDEFGNIYKSEKQKYFINKKIQLILKIDEYIRKIKISYHSKILTETNFIRKLKEYETKKQKIINEFELFKYTFPDKSGYKNIDICYYCKSGIINHCSCSGTYIANIPAESFEEKLIWLENKQWIDILQDMNRNITIQMKELMDLDDNCFNIWKYKYRFDTMRADKTLLLNDHPYIKKFDSLSKHYSDKLCWYCNFGVKKFCECSGHFIYKDQNGNEFTEEQDNTDEAYDQWHEQDRPDYQY